MVHDDGIALDVAETGGLSLHLGVKHLHGVVLSHRPGDHLGTGSLSLHDDLHFALGKLVAVGKQTLGDHRLGAHLHLHLGVAAGGVHATNLHRLQLHGSALGQIDDGMGVEDALSGALALTIVLFHVAHLGVFAHIEGVDAVVLGGLAAGVVDAAAGHNAHVAALADVEVVVHQVGEAGLGDNDRDVQRLVDGAGGNVNVDARLVLLALNDNVGGVAAPLQLAVFADVVRPLGNTLQVCNFSKQMGVDGIHAWSPPFTKAHPDWVFSRILGNISSLAPRSTTSPPAIMTISSARLMMRSWWEMMMMVAERFSWI